MPEYRYPKIGILFMPGSQSWKHDARAHQRVFETRYSAVSEPRLDSVNNDRLDPKPNKPNNPNSSHNSGTYQPTN